MSHDVLVDPPTVVPQVSTMLDRRTTNPAGAPETLADVRGLVTINGPPRG